MRPVLETASAATPTVEALIGTDRSRRQAGDRAVRPLAVVAELWRDARIGLGDRLGEVAEDVGRVVELDDVLGLLELPPACPGSSSGHDLAVEVAIRLEGQPLVVIVDDGQVADEAGEALCGDLEVCQQAASVVWLRSWKVSARS